MSDDSLSSPGNGSWWSVNTVAEFLDVSVRTVKRWNSDRSPTRAFPWPSDLPSPTGSSRPLPRWYELDIREFASRYYSTRKNRGAT
jgi:hypothetical protein